MQWYLLSEGGGRRGGRGKGEGGGVEEVRGRGEGD